MRKEDLLPTLHFSGLRSFHCINKRSLLCISLVEGTTDAFIEARIASINVINGILVICLFSDYYISNLQLVLIFHALNHVGERQGESCDSLFKSNGQSCVSSKLSALNQSEM
ncbi:hypothetical protein HYC85_003429 [Camellia sinensis]|uniref:Uncharacterized protein n=1 Tax=Camellia sinensis TaxID=4442 RepID=A0A7J7IBA0_CAMSI|nr:hypothetical protein HYC85_003429 [Camellia sinensis]